MVAVKATKGRRRRDAGNFPEAIFLAGPASFGLGNFVRLCLRNRRRSSPPPHPEVEKVIAPVEAGPFPLVGIVRVHDLAGYFADCGCSTEAAGGISRIPQKLPEVKNRLFLFTGWTILGEDELARTSKEDIGILRKQVGARIAVFSEMASVLGSCVWIVSSKEAASLAQLGVPAKSYRPLTVEEHAEVEVAGFVVSLGAQGNLVLGGTLRIPVSLPEMSRGRRVEVIVGWKGSGKGFQRNQTASGLLLTRRSDATGFADVSAKMISEDAGFVFASATFVLSSFDETDKELSEIASSFDLAIAHVDGRKDGVPALQPESFTDLKTCIHCHQAAVSSLRQSRHAHSVQTLRQTGRDADLRCLTCHTSDSVKSANDMKPLTCNSCHSVEQSPKETCTGCHTKLADPQQRFLKQLGTICHGKRDLDTPSSDPCSRVE